jgi:hypothetical protein
MISAGEEAPMLKSSRLQILEQLDDGALVLDVGGGVSPFERADWVIDLLPYSGRGLDDDYDPDPASELFSEATWVERDMCDRAPWPFHDRMFDFAICAHVLEDVRDPIWVCSELIRVAKRGYIEVPSRLEEQSWGVHGPWAGWSHHRWLIDIVGDEIEFVFKSHVLHSRDTDQFPVQFYDSLSPEQCVQSLWWEGDFRYRERIFLDGPSLDAYVAEFVSAHRPPPEPAPVPERVNLARRLRRRLPLRSSARGRQ